MDSTPDNRDHYSSEKGKKKKKKEKKSEENESNDEIKLSGEMDETIQKKNSWFLRVNRHPDFPTFQNKL
jgi:hypothetical protein